MQSDAMIPFGKALLDYFKGDASAEMVLERDDGLKVNSPVSLFFKRDADVFPHDWKAMELCEGRVLDIGAGAGLHALVLQEHGMDVTAIDISPEAVEIMRKRGVEDARIGDIFHFPPEPFDTLLLLGRSIGMVEDLAGLDRFLMRMKHFLKSDGRLLLNSLDVTRTDDPQHLAYHDANIRACRYAGEVRMRILYKDLVGAWYTWLQVDATTLASHAERLGWKTEVIDQDDDGNFLARLIQVG
jgi:cyclopropane fatty-acyl-phospholipid synthase-like methyltransferase